MILTTNDKRLVRLIERNGCFQVHRYNKLCWHRRERLLMMAERGIIKLTLPVMGSYYNFSKGTGIPA